MNPEKIRFNCPSCGIQLDVPASLAGVTGPCPKCQNSITAPHPQVPQPAPVQPAPQQEVAPAPTPQPPVEQQPVYQTEPIPAQTPASAPAPQNYSQPAAEPVAPPQEPQQPAGQNVFPTVVPDPVQPEVHPTPDEPPFPIEPQPATQLPDQRSSDGHASAQPTESPEPLSANSNSTPTKQGSRLPSIIFLLLFLLIAAILVFTILNMTGVVGLNNVKGVLGLGGDKPQAEQVVTPTTSPPATIPPPAPAVEEQEAPPAPPAEENPVSIDPEDPASEEPTPQLPEGENYREGETPLPAGLSANTDDPRQVQKILESFLKAENLSSRKNYISTESLQNPKLATSPLANPIPDPTAVLFLNLIKNEQEKRTDFFYVASWDGEANAPPMPMAVELHKWPGSEPPRVNTEAFLEFYQQKLRSYAATPLDRPARFFVLARCLAKCFEAETVPNHANKATLKLSSFPNDNNPVKAYFNKKGEMLEKIKEYRNGLAFRKDIPMTVTLEWSKPVDNMRYLELRIIDSFDWHP